MEPFEINNEEHNEMLEENNTEAEERPILVDINKFEMSSRYEDKTFIKLGAAVGLGYLAARGIGWIGNKIATIVGRAFRSVRTAWRADKEAEMARKEEQKKKIKEESKKDEDNSSTIDGEPVEQDIVDKNGKTVKRK